MDEETLAAKYSVIIAGLEKRTQAQRQDLLVRMTALAGTNLKLVQDIQLLQPLVAEPRTKSMIVGMKLLQLSTLSRKQLFQFIEEFVRAEVK